MRIILTPQRRDDFIVLTKSGETLTINNDVLDFSILLPLDGVLPDYETNPDATPIHQYVLGAVRKAGKLSVTVLSPHGPNPDEEEGFPTIISDTKTGKVLDQSERAKQKLKTVVKKFIKNSGLDESQLQAAIIAGLKIRTDAGLSEYRATAEMLAIIREWITTGELVNVKI